MAKLDLERRPDARAESVEDIVQRVLRGEVRIPRFQRPLKWQASDVVDLFDSVYRGYPIGSLLLRQAPGPAGPLQIGPLSIFGAETDHALWVVDGQQRLTSLAVGLGRPPLDAHDTHPKDPFVVFFDPRAQQFHAPPTRGQVPLTWVPVSRLLDAAALGEWIVESWDHGNDPALRRIVFEAGKRLREYRVPYYVIETPDEEVAKTIFDRVNSKGRALDREDVFNALFGNQRARPATLRELSEELAKVGMGAPDEESMLLPALVASRGLDVTRPFGELAHEHPAEFEHVMPEGATVLRRVLGFLRTRGEIPHLRLLPFATPFIVLSRFFAVHPEPGPRSEVLLVRWLWRCLHSANIDDRTLRRRAISSVDTDEEASVQRLLELVDRERPTRFVLPETFDSRAAASRLTLLAAAAQEPRQFAVADGTSAPGRTEPLDVAAAIEEHDKDLFRRVFPGSGGVTSSPANRILSVGSGSAREELVEWITRDGADAPLLRTHFIDGDAARALVANDAARFVQVRCRALADAVDAMAERLAEWGRNDRPSIEYLLRETEGA